MMLKKTPVIAVILASVSISSMSAVAGKATFPGSMCIKWNSGVPEPALSASKIQNPSSNAWLRVDCPVVRTDFDSYLHDASVGDSWVRMVDRNPNENGRCRLVSYSHNDSGHSSFWGTPTRYTTDSGNQAQWLDTNGLDGENDVSHLYFSCHVPPAHGGNRSSLTTYYVSQ